MRSLGVDENGDPISQPIGSYATKAEAEQALALDTIMPTSKYANVTLEEIWKMWIKTRAFTDIKKQTQDNYKAAFKYLSQHHKVRFADLRTAHFQSAIDKANEMGKSHSTMEKIKALCNILSEYAYSQDITTKNYVTTVRLPKEIKKKIDTFNDIEIAKLFKNDTIPFVDTILIFIYTVLFGLGMWGFIRPPRFLKPRWVQVIESQPVSVYQGMRKQVKAGENWRRRVSTPEELDAWIKEIRRQRPKKGK
jgi:hypothetical protein